MMQCLRVVQVMSGCMMILILYDDIDSVITNVIVVSRP